MSLNLSNEGLLTIILAGLTIWLGAVRARIRTENNWPLIYYLLLVLYQKRYPDNIAPLWVYVGVVNALFLRFEFIGGIFVKILRAIELVVLAYVVWRSLAVIFY